MGANDDLLKALAGTFGWNDQESAKNQREQLSAGYNALLQQGAFPNLYASGLRNIGNLSGFSAQQLAEPQPLPQPSTPDHVEPVEPPFPYPTIESCRDRERAVIQFKFKCVVCEGYVHLTEKAEKYCIAYQLEEPVLLCDERKSDAP